MALLLLVGIVYQLDFDLTCQGSTGPDLFLATQKSHTITVPQPQWKNVVLGRQHYQAYWMS
jgi:hypothetical protein